MDATHFRGQCGYETLGANPEFHKIITQLQAQYCPTQNFMDARRARIDTYNASPCKLMGNMCTELPCCMVGLKLKHSEASFTHNHLRASTHDPDI